MENTCSAFGDIGKLEKRGFTVYDKRKEKYVTHFARQDISEGGKCIIQRLLIDILV